MATFKNSLCDFFAGVKCLFRDIIRWTLILFICAVWTAICMLALLTSPLWIPVYAIINSERCSFSLYANKPYDSFWVARYLKRCWWAMFRVCRWLYSPLIKLLPMKYRFDFIFNGDKRIKTYPVKTQVAYYSECCDESKQSLIRSSSLSQETFKVLWEKGEYANYANFVHSGVKLSTKQIDDLCKKGETTLLWDYLKGRTPDKETLDVIIHNVRGNYAAAIDVMIRLIKQNRPNNELVSKLLNINNESFVQRVAEVLDLYADMDAVEFGTENVKSDNEDVKQKVVAEKWTNFCMHKKDICRAAQKKMSHAQYRVFAETGHKLDFYALQYLLLNVPSELYLKEMIVNEFATINAALQTALKAEYWRYSVYLAVAAEKKSAK